MFLINVINFYFPAYCFLSAFSCYASTSDIQDKIDDYTIACSLCFGSKSCTNI